MNVPAAVPSPPGPPPRPLKARLIGLLLRPKAPPTVVGIAVAAVLITAETLTVHHLQQFGPGNAFGAVFLFGVLIVSAGWDIWLAVATSLVSAAVYVYFHMNTHGALMPAEHNDIVAIAIFLPLALLTNLLVGQARLRAVDARRAEREIAASHAELTQSRSRIVAAGDQARRRFERDLHDGAQQRVVSLSLALRAVEASIPEEHNGLRTDIGNIVDGMSALSTELRELSRGIHPAILSRGGLSPALRALARRSPVPVELDLDLTETVPETVGVAAYYVVAEALTNTAKYAGATFVTVAARCEDGNLHLSISDDGVGGADAGSGSGLTGLKDRVAALSGSLDISSPPGTGTTLVARIPLGGG